jgi:hypothetical protein
MSLALGLKIRFNFKDGNSIPMSDGKSDLWTHHVEQGVAILTLNDPRRTLTRMR